MAPVSYLSSSRQLAEEVYSQGAFRRAAAVFPRFAVLRRYECWSPRQWIVRTQESQDKQNARDKQKNYCKSVRPTRKPKLKFLPSEQKAARLAEWIMDGGRLVFLLRAVVA
jgi:hypothetical protein